MQIYEYKIDNPKLMRRLEKLLGFQIPGNYIRVTEDKKEMIENFLQSRMIESNLTASPK